MAGYKPGYGNPYLYKLFSNSIDDEFNLMRALDDQARLDASTLSQSDNNFEAICMSGFRTGNNVGSGTDAIDGFIDSQGRLNIKVVSLDWKYGTYLNPLDFPDSESMENLIAMLPTVRSAYSYEDGTSIEYGQRLKCIKVAENKYEFLVPTPSLGVDNRFHELASRPIETSAKTAIENNTPTRLSSFVNLNLTPATKEQILNKAYAYDSSTQIPNKEAQLKMIESNCHPEFAFYVKAVIYDIWTILGGKVRLNKTYRTVGEQKIYRDKWDAWVDGGKVGKKPYAARPAYPGTSKHNHGTAADFNVYIGSKSYGSFRATGATKEQWEGSGIPAIIKANGLRWGGDFRSNYDPIHMDIPLSKDIQKKIIKKTKTMTDPKKAIIAISQISIGLI
jgi:hypothetical protein